MGDDMNRDLGSYPLRLEELIARYPLLADVQMSLNDAYQQLSTAFEHDNKVLICGNGGSAADSEHIAGELLKSFNIARPVDEAFKMSYQKANGEDAPAWLEGALPAIPLVSHVGVNTAFSNDRSSEGVFAQQVYALGKPGDVLIAISTSGNSANIVAAAKVACAKGMQVIALTGAHDSALASLASVCIKAPETDTYKIQELHLPIYHALCAALEERFFGELD